MKLSSASQQDEIQKLIAEFNSYKAQLKILKMTNEQIELDVANWQEQELVLSKFIQKIN